MQHVHNEKQILTQLQTQPEVSPFVVRLYETFTDTQNVCFIFEYLSGETLARILANEHRVVLKEGAQFYAAEILLALEYLHAQNIIYRDLKPHNVMLDS